LQGFPSVAFLELPAPPDIDARSIVKHYVLTMPLGNLVSRGADDGLAVAFGGEEFTFIYQASAVSRPVISLKGERSGTVEWNGEEVKQLYARAREWWANDKQAFSLDTPNVLGMVDSVRDTASQLGQFLSRIVLPNMESASEDDWHKVLTWLDELREVAAFPTMALPYVLLHRPAELPRVEKTILGDIGSNDEAGIRAAAKAIRHWAQLSASKRTPEIPPNVVTSLVERVAFRRKPAAASCLVQLTHLLAECPEAITMSDATVLSAALIPWHDATALIGDEGCSGNFDDQERMNLRACVGSLAGALRIWYSKTSPGVPEPLGIAKWEQWCTSDVLPEIRRAFRVGVAL
jgi:hypothetical protein